MPSELTPDWLHAAALHAAFDEHPCLIQNAWPQGCSVWSIDHFDRCLSAGLGWPEVRLFKDGGELPEARYTVQQGAHRVTDLDAMLTEYARGATLQTIGIDLFHAPLRALCDAVIQAFAPHIDRIHANAYLTPSDARGFDHHWDTHDVLVLQLEGRKHWQVHGAPIPFAAPEQVCGPHRALIDEAVRHPPIIDTVLEPGDLLYLPRGQIHAARAAGACSLHLTLGLHLNTRLSRLQQAWQLALEAHAHAHPEVRQALSQEPGQGEAQLARAREQLLASLAPQSLAAAVPAIT